MRITRDTLIKLAKDTVANRVRASRGLISAYAAGSLLDNEPLLGGVTDIDLILVHDSEPAEPREIVRLSPEIHLDIAHHNQSIYRHHRSLRLDPWLGFTVYNNAILLHDTQHWFEFIQAGVRSQFWLASNVMARVRPLFEGARQAWVEMETGLEDEVERVSRYLDSLEGAANAVACLSGSPLPERRFLLEYAARAKKMGNPGLSAGLAGLMGSNEVEVEEVRGWLPDWQAAFQEGGTHPGAPVRLNPIRLAYYERGIDALLSGATPEAALWPLLSTWTRAVRVLEGSGPHRIQWHEALEKLQLDSSHFAERLTGLDAYLDTIEEDLEHWAAENGG